MPSMTDDPNHRRRPVPITLASAHPLPEPDLDMAPVLVSRDYSRLRALARLWLRPDDPVGRALADKLDACRVVRPDAVPPSVAVLGSRLVFTMAGGAPESRLLVMPEEYADGDWLLPVSSPLGAALLGAAAGQWVEVVERDGRRRAVQLLAVDHRSGLMPLAGGGPARGIRAPEAASADGDENEDPPPTAA